MDRQLTPNALGPGTRTKSPGDRVPAVAICAGNDCQAKSGNQIVSHGCLWDAPVTGHDRMIQVEPRYGRSDTVQEPRQRIDFRNYQFGEAVVRDTTIPCGMIPEI
jgi:hypothetical protein